MRIPLLTALISVPALATGCATVVPLTDGGAQVREITSAEAAKCTFLREGCA